MKRFRQAWVLLLIFTVSLIFSACSSNHEPQNTYTLKLSHEMAVGTPEALAAEEFAANVNEMTNGAVTIEVFPHGQLGDPSTAIDSALLGNIDIVVAASGNFARYDPIFNIDSTPYLFKDSDTFIKILQDSGATEEQMQILNENGFVLLNEARNYFRGPYRVLCSTKPIETMDDLKGLRLRAFENTSYMRAYDILGANPIILPWSEVFTSLQQGLVDAAACAIGSLKSEGFTEVAPYVANVNEYISSILIVGTSSTFDTLPEEYVEAIKQCADQWGNNVDSYVAAELDQQIEGMKEGGAIFTDVDTAAAREALTDFYYSLEEEGVLPAGTVDLALSTD